MRAADLAMAEHQSGLDLPPAADVWIGNNGPVVRQARTWSRPTRQIVMLSPESWRTWLDLSGPEAKLLRPRPAGSLRVDIVRRGREDEPALI